jgi:Protein of unknown function (DUF2934)
MEPDKEARIRERAYEIWVNEGRPHGRDAEHWQRAAAEINAESGAVADPAAAGSKPRTEAPSPPSVAPSAPSSSATPPLRSRRAAKPASGATESGAGGRRGRKTPGT